MHIRSHLERTAQSATSYQLLYARNAIACTPNASLQGGIACITIFGPTLNPFFGLPSESLHALLPLAPSSTIPTQRTTSLLLAALEHILTSTPLSFTIPSRHLTITPVPSTPSESLSDLLSDASQDVTELISLLKATRVDDERGRGGLVVGIKEGDLAVSGVRGLFEEWEGGGVCVTDVLREELGLGDWGEDVRDGSDGGFDEEEDEDERAFLKPFEDLSFSAPHARISDSDESHPYHLLDEMFDDDSPNNVLPDYLSLDPVPIFVDTTFGEFLGLKPKHVCSPLVPSAGLVGIPDQTVGQARSSTKDGGEDPFDEWSEDDALLSPDMQEIVDILETMAFE
ncbi:hypothetical protein HDV00_006208 [Rhizophlyctis rosea]|nr:hypothetical protein HDV00_006208 [Rhizophlyctis rosea]